MNNLFLGLKFAFSYFSLLPVKFKKSDDLSQKEVLGYMQLFFPLVGFALAILTALLYGVLLKLGFLGAYLSSFFYMAMYGFLHTEAIIDVADAIYAKHSGKDAYKIIKEPTVGALGVLWGSSFVFLKLFVMATLLKDERFLEFFSIVIVSRISIVALMRFGSFRSSFVTTLQNSLNGRVFLSMLGLYTVLGMVLTGGMFFVFLFMAIVFTFLLAKFFKAKLGFINGDVLGASLEVVEVVLALGVLLWL